MSREILQQSDQMQDDLDRRYLTSDMKDDEYSRKCAAIQSWEDRMLGQAALAQAVADLSSHFISEDLS